MYISPIKCGCCGDIHAVGQIDRSRCVVPQAVEKIRAELAKQQFEYPCHDAAVAIYYLRFALRALGVKGGE